MKRGTRRLVRLRSASSQLPELAQKRWHHCLPMRRIARYFFITMVVLSVVMLNNLVMVYLNFVSRSGIVGALPEESDSQSALEKGESEYMGYEENKKRPEFRSEHVIDRKMMTIEEADLSIPKEQTEPIRDTTKQTEITPNEILQQAVIVIVSTDTACNVSELVVNFTVDYPDMSIYTTLHQHTTEICKRGIANCIRPRENCNEFCENNRLIDKVKSAGKKFVFVWHASFDNSDPLTLIHLAKKFADRKPQLVAPCVSKDCVSLTGTLHQSKDGTLTVLPAINLTTTEEKSCHKSHLLPPLFLTTTKTFESVQWDDHLDSGHHYDFALSLKSKKIITAVCTDVKVDYASKCSKNSRDQIFNKYLQIPTAAFKKWKIQRLYTGNGKQLSLSGDTVTQTKADWQKLDPTKKIMSKYITDAILHTHNDKRPGWMHLRLKNENNLTSLEYMTTSPCVYRIKGQLLVEYDRYSSFKNVDTNLQIDMVHLNRSCTIFQDYWSSTKYGKLPRKHVYYVTAVSNDTKFMGRLLQQLNQQNQKAYTHLIIVDMSRPGPEQFNVSQYKTSIEVQYISLGSPFSRSIGLRKGYDLAQKIAQNNGHNNSILFSVDTSMLLPVDFTKRVWQSTRCGVSSYAPMCYKELEKGDGFWVQYGYGMLGTCVSDYRKTGGWDPKWGYHWGAEDVDLMHQLQSILPYTVRVKEANYKHQHDEASREHSKAYYKEKNVYPKELPVTPQSTRVEDQSLIHSLTKYAIKTMKYNKLKLTLHTIYQTSKVNGGVLYDLRFTNSINEDYYALVESV